MNKKTIAHESDDIVHRLKVLAKEKEEVRKKLAVTAEELKKSYETMEQRILDRTKDLAQAKARTEAILANIGDGLALIDTQQKVLLLNKAGERLLGWKQAEIMGKAWPEVVVASDEQGQGYYKRKDGSIFPVAVTVTKMMEEDKASYIIMVFRDVTSEREIDKAKTEFVSLASHQLRTPLAAIKWYGEMLASAKPGSLTDEQREFIAQILTGNRRMIDLVSSLLDASRLDLGTFAVKPEPVDVVGLIKSVIQELAAEIERKHLVITQAYGTVPMMNLDPRLMRIIVQNLVTNAVHYTPLGGKVTVSAGVTGQQLRLIVADTGIGIPAHQQGQIFTKLFRADNVQILDTTGTGLGLYLVKSILDHVDGDISFTSTETKGTTFTVVLPLSGMPRRQGAKRLGD